MTSHSFETKVIEAQAIVDQLGSLASTSERAVALAEAGFPVCFARRVRGDGFALVDSSAGGVLATGARAFTTAIAQLRGRREEPSLTVALEVYDGSRRLGRAVYANRSGQIVPWREVVRITPDEAGASSAAKSVANRAPTSVAREWTLPKKTDAVAAVAKTRAAGEAAQVTLDAAGANLLRLRETVNSADRQADALERTLGARLAAEMLDGKEPEDSPPEVKKIDRLRRKRDAARLSTQLAQEAWNSAKQALTVANSERERAVLDWAAVEQSELIEKVREALAAIAPDLSRMIAVDRVKSAMGGVKNPTNLHGHPGLSSTKILAERLVRNTPQKISPDVFCDEYFNELASTATANYRAQLETLS